MTADEYINSNYDADTLALVWHGSYERSTDSLDVLQERCESAKKWYDFCG